MHAYKLCMHMFSKDTGETRTIFVSSDSTEIMIKQMILLKNFLNLIQVIIKKKSK